MKIEKLEWSAGENSLAVLSQGSQVACLRFCANRLNQIEFADGVKQAQVHQVLAHAYILLKEEHDAVPTLLAVLTIPLRDIKDALSSAGVEMIYTRYSLLTEALAIVLKKVNLPRLSVAVHESSFRYREQVVLSFAVHSRDEFIFWELASPPNADGFDLHIVPVYHPCMRGKIAAHMINGDTDYRVQSGAIIAVQCPEESRVALKEGRGSSTWSHVQHPFFAKGSTLEMLVSPAKLRTTSGVKELVSFLRAALDKSNEYVCVSGGFRAPLKCAHNLLVEKNIPSPMQGATSEQAMRGSEAHCVWAYRILSDEQKLKESYVPLWFMKEGWLELYKDAEVRHGLY